MSIITDLEFTFIGNMEALQLETIAQIIYFYTKYTGEDKKSAKLLRVLQKRSSELIRAYQEKGQQLQPADLLFLIFSKGKMTDLQTWIPCAWSSKTSQPAP